MDSRGIAVSRRTLALLEKIGTPTLAGMLTHRMGFRNNYMTGILPLAVKPDQRMVGRARTLRFMLCVMSTHSLAFLALSRPARLYPALAAERDLRLAVEIPRPEFISAARLRPGDS